MFRSLVWFFGCTQFRMFRSLVWFFGCTQALHFAEFIRTKVYEHDLDQSYVLKKDFATEKIFCTSKCLEDPDCRRVLFCRTGSLCWLYLEGANCISPQANLTDCTCYKKIIGCNANGSCTCPWGQFGSNCEEYITDCTDGASRGIVSPLVVEVRTNIKPTTAVKPFEITCDFNSGGHSKILDRQSTCNRINFNRSLVEYEEGFGTNPFMNWAGFTQIRQLVSNPSTRFILTVVFVASDGSVCYSFYNNFNLGPAPDYKITGTYLAGYSKCGDSLSNVFNKPFSTFDRESTTNKCSSLIGGGWWYKDDVSGCSDTKGVLTAMPDPFWKNDKNNDIPKRITLKLKRFP